MQAISPQKIFIRADGIGLRICKDNMVELTLGDRTYQVPGHVLDILSVFAEPMSLNTAMQKLKFAGRDQWMAVSATLLRLCKLGILTDHELRKFTPHIRSEAFGSAAVHIRMLDDTVRTTAFLNAIAATVKQGDVVLDIGTGTGVLAIAAAKAGAGKVYAIEAGAMADVAEETFKREGLADRITLIRRWSRDVELPEKADVLVSEIIGNHPFGENILPVFLDARKRLLKPGALLVPGTVEVFALPVMLPPAALKKETVTTEQLNNWKNLYGTDFSALTLMTETARWLQDISPTAYPNMALNNDPIKLCEADLHEHTSTMVDVTVSAVIQNPFNAMLLFFRSQVGAALLTNDPLHTERATHWGCPVRYFPQEANNAPGGMRMIRYTFRSSADTELLIS